MRIDNATFRAVDIRWNSIQLPLRAGTPVSLGGVVANDGNAIGIICQTIRVAAPLTQIPVLVGGDVLLDEVKKSYGETLTGEAIAAMRGIRFYDIFGRVVGEGGGSGLPEVTAADNGKVLGVSGGAWDKVAAPKELPNVTSADNGKMLGVANGAWGKVDAPSVPQIEIKITWSQWYSAQTADLDVLSKITFSIDTLAAVAAGNGKCIINTGEGISDFHTDLSVADVVDDIDGSGEFRVLFAGDSLSTTDPSAIVGSVEHVYLFIQYLNGAFYKALLRRILME